MLARDLDAHITEAHRLLPGEVNEPGSEPVKLTGADRNVRAAAIASPFVLIVLAVLAGILGNEIPPHFMVVLVLVPLGLSSAYLGKILPARVALDDDFIVLRYGLRLFRCKLPLTAKREVGALYVLDRGMAMGGGERSHDWERGGAYLRFASRWSSITVGCERVSGLGRYWNQRAWREGGKRRRWDITLDPVSFAVLQYSLAERGILSPRPGRRK